MPAKAKVGSWLDKSNGSGVDEAYESSDPDEEGSSGAAAGNADKLKEAAKNPIEEGSDDGREVDEGVDETKREVDIDWELVMPKMRPTLEDQSKKRRRAFIEKYLYVNDISPPSPNVAPIVQTILQTLPLLPLADQLDDAVAILRALVERDETISESSTKLGDKLVKWVSGETEKITSASRSVTVAAYMPYLFLILGLLSSFKASRSPLDQLISTPTFQDLFVSLAYISDAIEAKDTKGKENAKLGRARRKAYTRLWRVLRDYRSVLPAILHSLLTKAVTAPSRLAVLIGHVAGVLVRLRPKGAGGDADRGKDGSAAIETEKEALVSFYGTNIIGSKTPLQPHVAKAFNPILPLIIDQQTLIDKLIPAAERMLLRSPENALELTAELLRGSGVDISSILPAKLVPSTLSASKSSNAETRTKSVSLMSAICERCLDAAVRAKVITEVLALAKTGKTASPEHRTTLFHMSAVIQPSDEVSPIVVETLLPLVGKEGNDLALLELGSAVRIHLAHLLRSGLVISPVVLTALGKELSSPKLPIRRMLSDAVGQAIWTVSEGREHQFSAEGEKFLDAILPSLEANLQSASANVPSNPTGFLEGYVAVALALGPLQQVKSAAKFVAAAKTAKTVSPKPSFVLNERAYTKIPSGKDEMWLLRSLEGLIRDCKNAVPAEAIRVSLGSALLHQILRAGADDVRATAIRSLPTLSTSQSVVTHAMVHDGLHHWLTAQDAAYDPSTITSQEDGEPSTARTQKISQLLDYLFSPKVAQAVDKQAMQEFAVDMLIIAHHPLLTEGALTSWINLVQSAGLDPADLAVEWREKIVRGILSAAEDSSPRSRFPSAAYRAITTLAFVQPALYVPTFMDQIRSDLNPSNLDFIGLEERGIWITPADQSYVDVLAQKKDTSENKNRRDYATEKWEAEIRESLAKKRAAAGTTKLSKADQAAVNAQLAKEAEVRTKISAVQARMKRGLEVVYALTASNAERVEREVGELAQILLSSAFSEGSFLLDQRAFEVFMALSTLVTDRLGEYRRLLIAAILRSHDAPLIADDYLQESVQDLVTRLLHQLLFVASQKPLDATSYTLISVLFGRVVKLGGVGMESPQSEEAQEQLTLVVNIISACCGEFSDDAYPRLETISHLQSIISRYPRLAKDGSAALVDLGAAIQDNAQSGEVKAMIAGTLSQDYNVRSASLQALQPVDLTELDYSQELWIALHDADEQNASLAAHLWEDNGLDLPESYLESLMRFLAHESPAVRISTAGALTAAAQQYPSQIEPTISGLQELYKEKAKLLQPEFDRFGMVIPETVNRQDPWESRVAIALALQKLTPLISDAHVEPIINFMVFGEALGDRSATVRRAMLDAATAIIDSHGGKSIASLMKTFEDYLGRSTPSSETDDYIKEAVVILFGRLAGHLDSSDDRIPKVVDRLLDALNTPSELVQSAVADCLPTLVSGMGDDVEYLVDKLFSALTTGAKYAGRRGAAYGLAGVVKGRGLGSLKEYDLMDKLREAAEDKSTYQSRQGALFAFETLSTTLGKTFEPYIISIVPLLLALFGDSNTDVREATQDASKVIMSKISGHCVKLMLPDLLDALEEKQWRTKKGAIELLGAMAFCAPRQLSLSLPTIIPQLTGVINDSHAQVKSAANTSLKRFGEVLENPEVKAMQSTLMKALADPTAKTANALSVLLKTRFEHYLDAPSLALVMPIIDRGLRQRSSETRRKSVQIVGNMASLTESRDLVPYLHELMPLVHEVLVDPVPEARATAAKSLGTLVERLGETNFPELVNQLTTTLKSDTSGVDRQGAAQGLSEVLSGLGMERLENMLPEIVSSTASPRPYVREGFISLLVYLPATFGHRFAPHLGRVIPPILNGLADDSEFVREASMRAGKMIISNYSNKAIDLLLPELEKGMLDSAWRIRQSSISLTGELLYRVTGISGKVEMEEEEQGAAIDNARKALLDALGQERRDRVLATLYIVRQDAIGIVRQASIHIWKALVQNTPRTTREILPVLMQILMSLLGSDEGEQQETASRTLGELCRKNGERIFGEIIPILQKAISSPDARSREGACLAFADIMAAANKEVLADYEDQIIGAIRKALVDPESSVRSAAAQTFDTAQHYMGAKAVDQTIPTLLEAMRNPGETSETALQALKEVMSVRANSVFPVLIPTLTVQPITAFNARALGALVRVAGSALNKRLDTVLGALVKSLEKEQAEDVKQELLGAIEALLSSIVDADGIHQLEMLLIGWAKDKNAVRRATACQVFGTLCQVSQADTSEYRIDWIRILVTAFDDPVPEVVEAAWEALEHFVKTIDKDELEDLVVPLRRAIESTGAPGKHVAGFSRPKGVQSIVPILLAGVLSGTQEQREQAALGVGDLVQRTSEAAIKPYIIQLTGPLIRVISGQGLAPQIKSAILATLTVLLEEVPQLVRPFHPQLTRTFVKSASDPAALSVRNRAAAGLGELMKHQPRVDPLITELIGAIRSAEKDIAPSIVQALAAVCSSAGKNIGPAARGSIIELVEEAFAEPRGESYNNAIGKVVSGLGKNDAESIRSVVDTFLTAPMPPTALVSITILSLLEEAPTAFFSLEVVDEVIDKVKSSIGADSSAIARPAREARDIMKEAEGWRDDSRVQAAFK